MKNLSEAFHAAILRRKSLTKVTNSMRLVNGLGDGMDGLFIDRYGTHISIQLLDQRWQKELLWIKQALCAQGEVGYLIVKHRDGLNVTTQVLIEGSSQTLVTEHGLRFSVDLNDGLNCGLFLDMRQNRNLVAAICRGKRVLNCFAYTCSFGVYARAQGAREVFNVDISPKVLARGEANYALNEIIPGANEFIRAESMVFLKRAIKKDNYFDVIIIDPPSFARHEGKTWVIKRDLPDVVAMAIQCLNPRGVLFVTTNCSELTHSDLEGMIQQGLNGRRSLKTQQVGQDVDFVGTNRFKESYLVGLLVSFV